MSYDYNRNNNERLKGNLALAAIFVAIGGIVYLIKEYWPLVAGWLNQ